MAVIKTFSLQVGRTNTGAPENWERGTALREQQGDERHEEEFSLRQEEMDSVAIIQQSETLHASAARVLTQSTMNLRSSQEGR